jgi:hypothetical protein
MNGLWAVWPERMFVTYDVMRMKLRDDLANGDAYLPSWIKSIDDIPDEDLVDWAGEHWTFTAEEPSKSVGDYDSDHDYSMNW